MKLKPDSEPQISNSGHGSIFLFSSIEFLYKLEEHLIQATLIIRPLLTGFSF